MLEIYGDGKTFNPSKLASTRSYKLKSKTEFKLNFIKAISDCSTTVDFLLVNIESTLMRFLCANHVSSKSNVFTRSLYCNEARLHFTV